MKKILAVIFCFLVLSLLSAAETPDWVYNDVSTAEKVFVSAYAKMSKKQNSIRKAQSEARNLLAEYINTVINEIVETYSSEVITDTETKAIDAFLSMSAQCSQATLRGAKQEEMWESPDGGVWVLMSIPTAEIEEALENAVDEAWKAGDSSAYDIANRIMNETFEKYFGENNEGKDDVQD